MDYLSTEPPLRCLFTLKKLRQHIGIVFQDADNQIIASSVLAEVSFGPMNLKLPRSEVEERVNTALNYMNISQFKDRPPHYLSGGEKKTSIDCRHYRHEIRNYHF